MVGVEMAGVILTNYSRPPIVDSDGFITGLLYQYCPTNICPHEWLSIYQRFSQSQSLEIVRHYMETHSAIKKLYTIEGFAVYLDDTMVKVANQLAAARCENDFLEFKKSLLDFKYNMDFIEDAIKRSGREWRALYQPHQVVLYQLPEVESLTKRGVKIFFVLACVNLFGRSLWRLMVGG